MSVRSSSRSSSSPSDASATVSLLPAPGRQVRLPYSQVSVPPLNPYLNGLADWNAPDLVQLVHLATGITETTELEWKREWELDSKPRRAELARHIIGFAN